MIVYVDDYYRDPTTARNVHCGNVAGRVPCADIPPKSWGRRGMIVT